MTASISQISRGTLVMFLQPFDVTCYVHEKQRLDKKSKPSPTGRHSKIVKEYTKATNTSLKISKLYANKLS